MSELKHTPGPWEVDGFCNTNVIKKVPSERHLDCFKWINLIECKDIESDIPLEEAQANAKLIAAAPDLLEALNEITMFLDSQEMNVNSKEFEMWKIGNDALRKAVG